MSHDLLKAEGMALRSCPLCGESVPSRVYSEADIDPSRLDGFAFASRKQPEYMHHRLLECSGCDLVYASPMPSAEALAAAYDAADFDSGEEAWFAARTYARALPSIVRRLPDRDGAIDIGTGDGVFLEELLAAGFTRVEGVEPSAAPIAAAKDAIRPLIRHAPFRAGDFEADRYALITCFQTMEHVADPLVLARSAFELLKPGGAAYFIGHNRRAPLNRLLGKKSPIFDIEHMQLFSPRSAQALLERAGFTDVRTRQIINRYPLRYWMRLAPLPSRLKRFVLAACSRTGIGRVPVPMAVGNLAVVGFKPSGGSKRESETGSGA